MKVAAFSVVLAAAIAVHETVSGVFTHAPLVLLDVAAIAVFRWVGNRQAGAA